MKKAKKRNDVRCPAYRNPKTSYGSRAVAEYDRRVLEVRCPEFQFNVFRCQHCGWWHIGRGPAEAAS